MSRERGLMSEYDEHGLYKGMRTHMRTFTGRRVNPTCVLVEDIDIADIAHSLARQGRFNGHTTGFISVADHCVRVHDMLYEDGYGPEGLMHDAAEAYLGDIIRPLKYSGQVDGYFVAEEVAERAIAERFGLRWPWPPQVHEADDAACRDELDRLWGIVGDPARDEARFMERYGRHW